ncbi:hypothetical protein EG328_011590 [Venturia inaequalis]|uniref:Uncharacterized protein n=1 Tax=Venturia inaequalis TaxID=5025 RepID=A0A8H3YMP0_VENIN|nr:hypothetical protein EG328_011590 [Venturia inaequalis]
MQQSSPFDETGHIYASRSQTPEAPKTIFNVEPAERYPIRSRASKSKKLRVYDSSSSESEQDPMEASDDEDKSYKFRPKDYGFFNPDASSAEPVSLEYGKTFYHTVYPFIE